MPHNTILPAGASSGSVALTVSAVITKEAWGSVDTYSTATVTVTPEVGTGPAQGGVSVSGTDDDAWQVTEWGGEPLDTPVALDSLTAALESFSIAQGETFTFKVRFVPTGAGAKSATLAITNSDGSTAASFALTGTWSDAFLLECLSKGVGLWSPREYAAASLIDGDAFEDLTLQGYADHVARMREEGDWAVVADAIGGGGHASLAKAWQANTQSGTYSSVAVRACLTIEQAFATGVKTMFIIVKPSSWYSYFTHWANVGTIATDGDKLQATRIYQTTTTIAYKANNGSARSLNHGSPAGAVMVCLRRDDTGGQTYLKASSVGGTWGDVGSVNNADWNLLTGSTVVHDCSTNYMGSVADDRIYALGLSESGLTDADLEDIFDAM